MSYVPPHLRISITTKTLDSNNNDNKLNNSSQHLFHSNSSRKYNNNNSLSALALSNAARRCSSDNLLSPPEHVVPLWTPSDRVLRLNPQQIEEVQLRLNVDVIIPADDSSPAYAPIESFTDMCLDSRVMNDIAYHDYTTPTSIQAQAMPVALSGRDLLGCAETGSGKTAAFIIPMIQHCLAQNPVRRGDGPLALVLAPTRELAQHIEKEVR